MPLATCTVSGTIYDVNGAAVSGVNVYVDKLEKSGSILQRHRTRVATSDSAGLISFAVPRSSTIWLSGQFFIDSTSYHVNGGVMLAVPEAATATLISLEALPTEGIVVQSAGTSLASLIGTLNITGATVTQTANGVALIAITAGAVTDEQVQDALATFFADSGAYDWTYDDALNKVTLVIAPATTSVNGLLSATDKTAIDALGARNAANGYPGLNGSGLLTESQIPSSIARDSETTAAIDAEAATRASADSVLTTALDGKVDENTAITGATKTKVTYDAKGLVTSGTDATTADIADSSNKRYVTDADLTDIGNLSGVNSGDQVLTDVLASTISNGDTTHAPDGNSVFDALALKAVDADVVHDTGDETIAGVKTFSSDPLIPDEVYGVGWNGSLEPPTKNAVYDKIETLGGGGITNSAGNNILPKSDGTNIVASRVSDDGTNILLNIGDQAAGTIQFGGTGAMRPGLRTNGAVLEAVLADQSNFAKLKVFSLAVADVAPPSTGGTIAFLTNHLGEVSGEMSVLNSGDTAYVPLRVDLLKLLGSANLTVDLGLGRNAAGIVEINNGTPGTLRDLTLRNLIINGSFTGMPETVGVAVSDETTDLTTGAAKVTFRMPFAMTVTAVRSSLSTASSSGLVTVNIKEAGTTILSTMLSIDASEKTSTTAATPAVISDSALADDAEITIDIDAAGTGAKGLKVWLIGVRA